MNIRRVFGLEVSQNSKHITHFSKLYLTQNPKLKKIVWLQYLKIVPHISVLNFFTFWWNPKPAQVRRLVFSSACPLLSPFTQYCFVFLSPQTHTPNLRERSELFSFLITSPSVLPVSKFVKMENCVQILCYFRFFPVLL